LKGRAKFIATLRVDSTCSELPSVCDPRAAFDKSLAKALRALDAEDKEIHNAD
jgi:hypothetical protein